MPTPKRACLVLLGLSFTGPAVPAQDASRHAASHLFGRGASVAHVSRRSAAANSRPSLSTRSAAYKLIDLGALGGDNSGAQAINNKGQVVGWAEQGGGTSDLLHTAAFLWQNGQMRALPLASDEHVLPTAFAINDLEQILVRAEPHARGNAALNMPIPGYQLLLHNGAVAVLNPFTPNALNNKGQIVGWTMPPGASWPRPALWQAGHYRTLFTPEATMNVQARAINDRGDVAGVSSGKDADARAWVYRSGETVTLDLPAGYKAAEAVCINNKRQVVVWAWSQKGHASALLWQPSAPVSSTLPANASKLIAAVSTRPPVLKQPPFACCTRPIAKAAQGTYLALGGLNGEDHWAYGLNNRGQVVGSSGGHAFLWQQGKMLDLNALVPANSGWLLREARGINDKGQVCGSGTFEGHQRAFLLTPAAQLR